MSLNPIPILRIGDVLIVPLQGELGDKMAETFQQAILERIDKTSAPGLVLEISALELVDTYVARVLTNTAKMARLMGTRTIVAGMRPEVAATLVEMGFDVAGLETALNVDLALGRLQTRRPGA